MTGQMLYGSGLRTAADDDAKTNSTHLPSYTVYNASLTHVIPLPWENQKMLLGFDIINLLDQKYFYNTGEGSIGLGSRACGNAEIVFLSCTMVLLAGCRTRPPAAFSVTHLLATYPKGTPRSPGWAVRPFWHPVWASPYGLEVWTSEGMASNLFLCSLTLW